MKISEKSHDGPSTYTKSLSRWRSAIRYEHLHRDSGSAVGALAGVTNRRIGLFGSKIRVPVFVSLLSLSAMGLDL